LTPKKRLLFVAYDIYAYNTLGLSGLPMLLAPAHIKDGFLGCREFFFLFFRGNYSDLLSNGNPLNTPSPSPRALSQKKK